MEFKELNNNQIGLIGEVLAQSYIKNPIWTKKYSESILTKYKLEPGINSFLRKHWKSLDYISIYHGTATIYEVKCTTKDYSYKKPSLTPKTIKVYDEAMIIGITVKFIYISLNKKNSFSLIKYTDYDRENFSVSLGSKGNKIYSKKLVKWFNKNFRINKK